MSVLTFEPLHFIKRVPEPRFSSVSVLKTTHPVGVPGAWYGGHWFGHTETLTSGGPEHVTDPLPQVPKTPEVQTELIDTRINKRRYICLWTLSEVPPLVVDPLPLSFPQSVVLSSPIRVSGPTHCKGNLKELTSFTRHPRVGVGMGRPQGPSP